jgi:hypothetical protein
MLTETVVGERRDGAATVQLSRDQLIDSIKAKVRIGDGNLLSAGVQLQEAKRRLPEFGMTWHAFFGECGLERSRVYVLLAIAEGKTTEEAEKAKGRERAARHAAKNKAARESVSNGQSAHKTFIDRIAKLTMTADPIDLEVIEQFAKARMNQRTSDTLN